MRLRQRVCEPGNAEGCGDLQTRGRGKDHRPENCAADSLISEQEMSLVEATTFLLLCYKIHRLYILIEYNRFYSNWCQEFEEEPNSTPLCVSHNDMKSSLTGNTRQKISPTASARDRHRPNLVNIFMVIKS